ncbi:MAG TPA: PKD domain-containing protein [Chryseolinea sp.]|nr:PKD domain-containing protein [Chryseolinea sp.]
MIPFLRNACYILLLTIIFGCQDDPAVDPENEQIACFSAPTVAIRNRALSFDASCSKESITYFWDFGDGTTDATKSPDHSFKSLGQFTVKLRVTSGNRKDSVSQIINVDASESETNCLPTYILRGTLWPNRQYDSISFSYLPDRKLDNIKWFPGGKSKLSFHRASYKYNGTGTLQEIQLYSTTTLDPFVEKLISTFFIDFDATGLPSRIDWVNVPGDSLRKSTFTYDEKNRLSQIRNSWGSSEFLNIRYEYGTDNNPAKVYYKPGAFYPERVARVNETFDGALPFYAASKELRLYYENIVQVEPIVNIYKTAHVFQTLAAGSTITYWGEGTWQDNTGVELTYTIGLNDQFLVKSLTNQTLVADSELHFSGVGYLCGD